MMTADNAEELRYKQKCKDLRKRIREIEEYNEITALSIERTKKAIQRARLERALLLERLEATTNADVEDSDATPSPPGSPVPPTAPFRAYCDLERENLKKENPKKDVEQLLVSTWKALSNQEKLKYVEEGSKRSSAAVKAVAGDISIPGVSEFMAASESGTGTPLDKDRSTTPGTEIKDEQANTTAAEPAKDTNGSLKQSEPPSIDQETELSESELDNSDAPPPSSEL